MSVVVHVVRDSFVRAPQKTHEPMTIVVNSGLLWSVANADYAAPFCKRAGRRRVPLLIAKVRVAGSSPVVRSGREKAQVEAVRGTKPARTSV